MKAQTEHAKICTQLTEAEHAYYGLDKPIMTDAEYDRLFRKLVDLESQYPELKNAYSPTARVGGAAVAGFAKIKHRTPMLSLDNAFSPAEVFAFFGKKLGLNDKLVAEPKIDGLSLNVTYKNGLLYQAVTRGKDGVGDDVTVNARTIRSLPLRLPDLIDIQVRGEVYMPVSVFEQLNRILAEDTGEQPFANPRNAASGTMKSHDPKVVAERHLAFIAYTTVVGGNYESHEEQTADLARLGFVTPLNIPTKAGKRVRMMSVFDYGRGEQFIDNLIVVLNGTRKLLDFETDGLVFKIDSTDLQSELGEGNHSPRWAVAYKYPAEQKSTRLLDIIITVGRTGQITPNAVLGPIQLAGTTVKAASLCNMDEIKRLGIDVGDDVFVQKSGEIIPKVTGVATKNSCHAHWNTPSHCPTCRTKLIKPGVHHFCPNKECPDRVKGQLLHAVGKGALDIDGCGDAVVQLMYECGVRSLFDLLDSGTMYLKGETRTRIDKGIEKAKSQPLWRKIYALGIEGIGTTASKLLAQAHPNFMELRSIDDTDAEELEALLGPANAQNFQAWMEGSLNVEMLFDLESIGFKFSEKRITGSLTGKSFVITGKLNSGTRDEVSAKIETAGGTTSGSVSKTTSYLVTNEASGSSKAKAAEKYGTKVITEAQLLKMIGC